MSRRDYAGGAQPTTSTKPFTAADVTLSVVALVGWPDGVQGPFAVCLDRNTPGEEKILCDTINGNDLHVIQRGYDGTTARDHSSGAVVEHVFTAVDAEEANAHVNSSTGVHGIPVGASVVGTSGQQTLTEKTIDLSPASGNVVTNFPLSASPDLQASLRSLENADAAEAAARAAAIQQEVTARDSAVNAEALARASADTAHVNAPDPHPQYLTQPEGDARYRIVGEITMFAGTVVPQGWLICDGSTISSTAYPDLVAVLGSTTLPDLRSRVPRGVGSGYAQGSTGGADTHALTAANLPKHTHAIDHNHPAFNTPTGGVHAHTISTYTGSTGSTAGRPQEVNSGSGSTVSTANSAGHAHSIDVPPFVGASGDGGTALTGSAFDTRDPYYTVNFIIRAT